MGDWDIYLELRSARSLARRIDTFPSASIIVPNSVTEVPAANLSGCTRSLAVAGGLVAQHLLVHPQDGWQAREATAPDVCRMSIPSLDTNEAGFFCPLTASAFTLTDTDSSEWSRSIYRILLPLPPAAPWNFHRLISKNPKSECLGFCLMEMKMEA